MIALEDRGRPKLEAIRITASPLGEVDERGRSARALQPAPRVIMKQDSVLHAQRRTFSRSAADRASAPGSIRLDHGLMLTHVPGLESAIAIMAHA